MFLLQQNNKQNSWLRQLQLQAGTNIQCSSYTRNTVQHNKYANWCSIIRLSSTVLGFQ